MCIRDRQQRVGIARALAQKPKVMLADEPVASLDPITSRVVMKYLKEINQELGITTIVNLHFLDLAKEFGERLIGLKDGELVYDGKVNDVSDKDFENIYGRAIKSSDLFVKALENEGVEYIFGIPGEENLDFLDSLSRSKKIKLILTRHEQGAGFMAAVYGRLTGKTGVCIATLGPGATNFTTCAAYAQLGGMPMMMITGQKPVKKSKQGRFQILDVVEMMKPITKYAQQLVAADNIPSRVREAFRIAEQEKPGAVHLELPEDIADEHSDELPIPVSSVRRAVAENKSIKAAVEKIAAAKSPILVVGAGGNRKLTSNMLTEFVDNTGIPFVSTQLGKGVIDERHPLFMGCAALSANDYVHLSLIHI